MQLVAPYIFHSDQTGFLKSIFIAENLMDINGVILETENQQIDTVIEAIDFEKAYDTVEWQALYHVFAEIWFWTEVHKHG